MSNRRVDEILKRFGFTRNPQTVWQIQNQEIIYHAVLEEIARELGIEWDPPQILRADREEAVVLVSGRMDGKYEWAIGEALVGVNYRVSGKQAGYVWAIASKRARDRLIYQFLGLQEHFDDSAAEEPAQPDISKMSTADKLRHNIGRKATLAELNEYIEQGPVRSAIGGLGPEDLGSISNFIQERRAALSDGRLPLRHGDGATVWDDMLNKAKTALSKAKNAEEVMTYYGLMLDQEFADAPAEIRDAFRDLANSRAYQLQ